VTFYRCLTPQPTTLAPAALAVLATCAADAAASDHGRHQPQPTDTGLIKLTVNEVRRLINTFIIRPICNLARRLHWSH
jgi:hypothetical protein